MKRTEGTVLRVIGNRLIALVPQTKATGPHFCLKMGIKKNIFAKNGSIPLCPANLSPFLAKVGSKFWI